MLTDVNRRYFGICGRFSAVNRHNCRRFPDKKGQRIFHPNKRLTLHSPKFVFGLLALVELNLLSESFRKSGHIFCFCEFTISDGVRKCDAFGPMPLPLEIQRN